MIPAGPVPLCVDASLIGAVLLPEPVTAAAERLWRTWVADGRVLIAPPHLPTEVISGIRRAMVRGRVPANDGSDALDAFVDEMLPELQIEAVVAAIWRRAWELAEDLRRANIYDALYLAIAEDAGAEFWTVDENLVRALEADGRPAPTWVRLLNP